jgi:hypothetical protein
VLIAIDYDETFTEDPAFWCEVIAAGVRRGHRFVCITGRSSPPDFTREPLIPLPIICAGATLKDVAARAAGYHVDVWVDDMPGLIKGSQTLVWDDEPDHALAPMPPVDESRCLPYSAIRAVAGYPETYVHEYAKAYARACIEARLTRKTDDEDGQ